MIGTVQLLDETSPAEAAHVLYHFGIGGYAPGSFVAALLNAFALADPENHRKLASVYPGYGGAMDAARNRADGIEVLTRLTELAPAV